LLPVRRAEAAAEVGVTATYMKVAWLVFCCLANLWIIAGLLRGVR
jgi:hypothetical protein